MELNYMRILMATALQFVCGAVWYSLLFGKLWGKIHGFDKLSKEVQEKMMKEMGPYYGAQLLVTVMTTVALAILLEYLPRNWNAFQMASLIWAGFVVPTQASAVIFGGTETKWMLKKIAVQAGASLLCLLIAAAVLR